MSRCLDASVFLGCQRAKGHGGGHCTYDIDDAMIRHEEFAVLRRLLGNARDGKPWPPTELDAWFDVAGEASSDEDVTRILESVLAGLEAIQ